MSDKKPLSAAENKARMDKGLAAGKVFYLRSGKKLRGKKADVAGGASVSPAAAAAVKADEGKAKKAAEDKAKRDAERQG